MAFVQLYYSLPYFLEIGCITKPGTGLAASGPVLLFLPLPVLGYRDVCHTWLFKFLRVCWGFDSGPHAYTASALTY